MAEAEKMEALKKAYAEIILNTAKEAAARILSSERRALRYQQELTTAKDEALKMLSRMKRQMDLKIADVETSSLSQRKKIELLEAQLNEAEDMVTDLRAELARVQDELEEEKIKNSQIGPMEEKITTMAAASDMVTDLRAELARVQDELEEEKIKNSQIGPMEEKIMMMAAASDMVTDLRAELARVQDELGEEKIKNSQIGPMEEKIMMMAAASDMVTDLRAELARVQDELEEEKKKNSQIGPMEEQIVRMAAASHEVPSEVDKTSTSGAIILSPNSELRSLSACHMKDTTLDPRIVGNSHYSFSGNANIQINPLNDFPLENHVENPDIASMIMRSKEPELYRNGYTQRIRAFERNLLDGKVPLTSQTDIYPDSRNESAMKKDEIAEVTCMVASPKDGNMRRKEKDEIAEVTCMVASPKDGNMRRKEKKRIRLEKIMQQDTSFDNRQAVAFLSNFTPRKRRSKCKYVKVSSCTDQVSQGCGTSISSRCSSQPCPGNNAVESSEYRSDTIIEELKKISNPDLVQVPLLDKVVGPQPLDGSGSEAETIKKFNVLDAADKDTSLTGKQLMRRDSDVKVSSCTDKVSHGCGTSSLSRCSSYLFPGNSAVESSENWLDTIIEELKKNSTPDLVPVPLVDKVVGRQLMNESGSEAEIIKEPNVLDTADKYTSSTGKQLTGPDSDVKVSLCTDQVSQGCGSFSLSRCSSHPCPGNSAVESGENLSDTIKEELKKNSNPDVVLVLSGDKVVGPQPMDAGSGSEAEIIKEPNVLDAADKDTSSAGKHLTRQDSDVADSSEFPISKPDLEIANLPMTSSSSKDEKTCEPSKGAPVPVVNDRLLKYTFRRKRKRGSMSRPDENAAPGTNTEEIKSKEKKVGSPEPQKSDAIMEPSCDSRQLVQVARQLVSLSEKKWRQ